jgi:hypothetical protein
LAIEKPVVRWKCTRLCDQEQFLKPSSTREGPNP